MKSVKIAFACAVTLAALAIGWTLTRSPTIVLASNEVPEATQLVEAMSSIHGCKAGEAIPAGTTAIRLTIAAEIGPTTTVTATAGGHVVAHGTRASGWTGGTVTVPVKRVARTVNGANVCFTTGVPLEPVVLFGSRKPGAHPLVTSVKQSAPGELGIEYLRAASSSWLSLVPTIAWRMGLGHAWPGSWIVFALLAAMLTSAALVSRAALKELG